MKKLRYVAGQPSGLAIPQSIVRVDVELVLLSRERTGSIHLITTLAYKRDALGLEYLQKVATMIFHSTPLSSLDYRLRSTEGG